MLPTSGISEGKSIYKSGKLLRIRAKFEGDKIKEIKITGDFFMYPEERIYDIENSLINRKIDEIEKVIEKEMESIEYEGIAPKDLSRAIKMAWKNRRKI